MNSSQSIMNDQHRATPKQWEAIKENGHLPTRSTILELLNRIEALEAAVDRAASEAFRAASTEIRPSEVAATEADPIENWGFGHTLVDPPVYGEPKPNHPEIPGGSLMERIKSRMIDGIGSTWEETGASVLVEIAAWLREHYYGPTAASELLEQEAKR